MASDDMPTQGITDNTKIREIDFGKRLNVRIQNSVIYGSLPETVGELRKLSISEIMRTPNFGRACLMAIVEKIGVFPDYRIKIKADDTVPVTIVAERNAAMKLLAEIHNGFSRDAEGGHYAFFGGVMYARIKAVLGAEKPTVREMDVSTPPTS